MSMETENSEIQKRARIQINELAHMVSVPMSLVAVIKLNVADTLWQGGANTPLSAGEILSRLNSSGDPENLQRVLRLLSSYGVFKEHLNASEHRRYSLTEVGKTLVTDVDGFSFADYVLQRHQDEILRAWSYVHEVVLEPTVDPFVKLYGEPPYTYYGKHPRMNEMMQNAMSGSSIQFMKALLSDYDGFQGVETLIDVGGSGGDNVKMILQKYPSIHQGINLDLPEVVAKAPHIPGVTYVGGNMFEAIPPADTIFMKLILSTWTDDECKIIMKNCYKSLPEGGKLIACEPVMPEDTDGSHRTRALLEGDIYVMSVYRAKAKLRTEKEFRQLGDSVGFAHFRPFSVDYFLTIMEFHK